MFPVFLLRWLDNWLKVWNKIWNSKLWSKEWEAKQNVLNSGKQRDVLVASWFHKPSSWEGVKWCFFSSSTKFCEIFLACFLGTQNIIWGRDMWFSNQFYFIGSSECCRIYRQRMTVTHLSTSKCFLFGNRHTFGFIWAMPVGKGCLLSELGLGVSQTPFSMTPPTPMGKQIWDVFDGNTPSGGLFCEPGRAE